MYLIHVLIVIFIVLMGYQYYSSYSSYLVEGFGQSDIDKINLTLTSLADQVNNINGNTGMRGDVLILKNKMNLIEPAVNDFITMKPTINEMIKVADKFIPCPSQ